MSRTLIAKPRADQRGAPSVPAACMSGGCAGPDPRRGDAPPSFGTVRVNHVEIAPEAIAVEIQHHPAETGEAAWRAAARALAIRELLLQEGARCGFTARPEEDETGRIETESEALVRAVLEDAVVITPASEADCRRYYDSNGHRFRTPELFEASHILIEPDGNAPDQWQMAEEEAVSVAAAVGDDRDAFAAAARECSQCPSAQQGGSLGQVRRGELVPAVQGALEELREGETGLAPVRSRFGYHILRLERRIPGHILPFAMVAPKIAEMLDARRWAIEAGNYTAMLARKATVEGVVIDPAAMGAYP